MPTQAEVEAAAECSAAWRISNSRPAIRICSADIWPDVDVAKQDNGPRNTPYKRRETFSHEARLALETAEYVRANPR